MANNLAHVAALVLVLVRGAPTPGAADGKVEECDSDVCVADGGSLLQLSSGGRGVDGRFASPEESPEFCSIELLKRTCPEGSLTLADLAGLLAADPNDIEGCAPGAWNAPVSCFDICQAAKSFLQRQETLPARPNLACEQWGDEMLCTDVSPARLAEVALKDGESRGDAEGPNEVRDASLLSAVGRAGSLSYACDELMNRVAEHFEMFPVVPLAVAIETAGTSALSTAVNCTPKQMTAEQRKKLVDDTNSAKGLATVAIRDMQSAKGTTEMKRWFGQDSDSAKRAALVVLNGALAALNKVELFYDGEACYGALQTGQTCAQRTSSGSLAYVMRTAPACTNAADLATLQGCASLGQGDQLKKVVYVCPKLFETKEVNGIPPPNPVMTMLHEATHHNPGATNDENHWGGPAYDRYICLDLGKTNPSSAIKNAANYEYFASCMVSGTCTDAVTDVTD